jgi:NADH dehydrogenase FAD-containing subunit
MRIHGTRLMINDRLQIMESIPHDLSNSSTMVQHDEKLLTPNAHIFAMGDCAADQNRPLPTLAQV